MSDNKVPLDIPVRPSHFYKYRSGSKQDIETLRKRKIWVPNFNDLNDIFENDFEFQERIAMNNANVHYPTVFKNDIGEPTFAPTCLSLGLEGEKLKQHQEKIKTEIHEFRENIFNLGVYSLATSGDIMNMWAYYADSHKGYCIKYKSISSKNVSITTPWPRFVIYQETPPKIEWSLIQHYSPAAIYCNMIFHKPKEFTWEKEYRALFENGNKEYDIPYEIESIIFGERAGEDLKDNIVEIFQAEIKYEKIKGTFKLKVIDDEYCKVKLM